MVNSLVLFLLPVYPSLGSKKQHRHKGYQKKKKEKKKAFLSGQKTGKSAVLCNQPF